MDKKLFEKLIFSLEELDQAIDDMTNRGEVGAEEEDAPAQKLCDEDRTKHK